MAFRSTKGLVYKPSGAGASDLASAGGANILALRKIKKQNTFIVAKKTAPLLPLTGELLRQFGDRLRLARLRRRLPAKQVAERAGMSPMTLRGLERGGSGVTMGAYVAVMQVLGIEKDLDLLGKVDPVGRELQDARLPVRTLPSRPPLPRAVERPATTQLPAADASAAVRRAIESSPPARDWVEKSKFASAEVLAGLIDHRAPPKKKVR